MIVKPRYGTLPARNESPDIDKPREVLQWIHMNATKITVDTILSTKKPRTDILLALLHRVRVAIRIAGPVYSGRIRDSKYRSQAGLRAEVHDHAKDFCFHMAALREYHPVNNAEIISIILKELAVQGIDARVSSVPQHGIKELGVEYGTASGESPSNKIDSENS